MRYDVLCKNFKQCVYVAEKFAKLYSGSKPTYTGTITTVKAGDNFFYFHYIKSDGRDYIKVEDFAKKYLTQNSQTV